MISIKNIVSYPGSIIFTVISIIIISLVMGFYLKAPSYITLLADIMVTLLIAILSLSYKCLQRLESKERITYCKTNKIYYAHAQSITGEIIYAYHPMQNLINIDKQNGENKNTIKEMKRIYEDITNEKIRQYHLFIEIKEYNQLEA